MLMYNRVSWKPCQLWPDLGRFITSSGLTTEQILFWILIKYGWSYVYSLWVHIAVFLHSWVQKTGYVYSWIFMSFQFKFVSTHSLFFALMSAKKQLCVLMSKNVGYVYSWVQKNGYVYSDWQKKYFLLV